MKRLLSLLLLIPALAFGQVQLKSANVLFTGGKIDGIAIGGTTPAAGNFTTLGASGLLTANAGLTVASGQTLTLTGATVAGAPTWSSSQPITLSTAAQPNVTSVGVLTGLTITSNQNAASPINLNNTTAGTNSNVGMNVTSDTGSFDLRQYSSTFSQYTHAGQALAGFGEFLVDSVGGAGPQGLLFGIIQNKPIIFVQNNAPVLTIGASGATTLAGTFSTGSNSISGGAISGTTLTASNNFSGPNAGFSVGVSGDSYTDAVQVWGSGGGGFAHSIKVQISGSIITNTTSTGLSVTGGLSATGNLTVFGTGPHSIGRAIDTNSQVIIGGTFAGAGSSSGLVVTSTLTAIAGSNSSAYYSAPTINKAGSGTHPDFATMLLDAPTIGAGAATLTNATTLKISGAPSVGTNQRALWVAAGLSQFDGALTLTGVGGAGTGVVSVGAADSGGTGYRVLRIPN